MAELDMTGFIKAVMKEKKMPVTANREEIYDIIHTLEEYQYVLDQTVLSSEDRDEKNEIVTRQMLYLNSLVEENNET